MGEQIGDFTLDSLNMEMRCFGLETVMLEHTNMSYGNCLYYPELMAAFRNSKTEFKQADLAAKLPFKFVSYSAHEHAQVKCADLFYSALDVSSGITVWGLAIELFAHYSYGQPATLEVDYFIDTSPAKHRKRLAGSLVVVPVLVNWGEVKLLIIYSSCQWQNIEKQVRSFGYAGQIKVTTQ